MKIKSKFRLEALVTRDDIVRFVRETLGDRVPDNASIAAYLVEENEEAELPLVNDIRVEFWLNKDEEF